MLRGSAWMITLRWSIRVIGLLSMVILARLLSPADFGIVAMSMMVVGFVELFSQMGIDLALIRNSQTTRDHYDSAWTLQMFQGLALAMVIFLIAPLASAYFAEPRVTLVIQVLALRALITGLENIGIVDFRKELDFARDFRFGVYKKLLAFAVTISLAFVLRNYWALVVGMVFAAVAGALLSYRMHPYRPKIAFGKIREIWSFAQWMLLWRLAFFLNRKIDQFLVGGTYGTSSMGRYYMAAEVATIPTFELVLPLGRGLFPNYAKMIGDPERFASALLRSFGLVAILCAPLGFGLSAVADSAVIIVLGEKWRPVIPLLEWFAIFGVAAALSHLAAIVLFVAG
ncbi:MAG: lipopolysaccharide biosynthesis protein, partial [Anaerolineae bacterium]|nr:lipopolysaccharide biosynthesis protein [Anaerolineae bacterium]